MSRFGHEPDDTGKGNGIEQTPIRCCTCQVKFSALKGITHAEQTGHAITYKGKPLTVKRKALDTETVLQETRF